VLAAAALLVETLLQPPVVPLAALLVNVCPNMDISVLHLLIVELVAKLVHVLEALLLLLLLKPTLLLQPVAPPLAALLANVCPNMDIVVPHLLIVELVAKLVLALPPTPMTNVVENVTTLLVNAAPNGDTVVLVPLIVEMDVKLVLPMIHHLPKLVTSVLVLLLELSLDPLLVPSSLLV